MVVLEGFDVTKSLKMQENAYDILIDVDQCLDDVEFIEKAI